MKVALTIAGSDPSGGAGIQADLKTFQQFQVYGMSVITLVTVQNSISVDRVEVLKGDLVKQQLEAVLRDIYPDALKLGALGNSEVIQTISPILKKYDKKIVVDPVMVSTQGASLFNEKDVDIFRREILNACYLVTPNRQEAEILSGKKIKSYDDFSEVAKTIQSLGAQNVLIKGGHMEGQMAKDYLHDQKDGSWYESPRFETKNTHGTGCTLSAAITAMLAQGHTLKKSIECAKSYVSRAIAAEIGLGGGKGPINHFVTASQDSRSQDR